MPDRSAADVFRLGRVPYAEAWEVQRRLQADLVAAKRADPPRAARHAVLVVEHPPVFTLGASGDAANVLASEAELVARGATFVPTDRGGDVTFHGPGQLVVYPILDLDRFARDLHLYLRALEEAVIQTCADYGVAAGRVDGRTGVWVGPDARGAERKICAMGIACSRWVTMHGLAFNLNADLDFFEMIVPCGIDDRDVTSLDVETGAPVDATRATDRLLAHFGDAFGADLRPAPDDVRA